MKRLSKVLAILLTLLLVIGVIPPTAMAAPNDQYPYNQPGDKNYVSNTKVLERDSSNNRSTKITAPRAQAEAVFTTGAAITTGAAVTVDGVRDTVWDAAISYPITNKFNSTMTAAAPGAATQGTVRYLWDGPVLYVLVEVTGDSTENATGTPNWSTAAFNPSAMTDGLIVNMDVFNDQWGIETDTQGVFFLPANPNAPVTSYTGNPSSGIPSLGSFFNPNYQDYSSRLLAYKSSGYAAGEVNYTYEFALDIEGWGDAWNRELNNGTRIGLDIGIFDQGNSFTYWSKTQVNAGYEGGSNLPNSERVRNRDWGEVTLAGWDGTTPFAYSGWRADEDIRYWNSKKNPGGSGNGTGLNDNGDGSNVWTPASKARMVAAKAAYSAIKDSDTATRQEKEAAVLEVCQAFAGLRWADTRYPDPHDLPSLNTLPDVWQFFDPAKGTVGKVTNSAEWDQRKKEILDLAQFYEYGYKPKLGVDYNIKLVSNIYDGTGNPTVTAQVIPTNVNFTGGVPQNITINITLPTTGLPDGQKAPVSFSGGYTASGIADITFPNWGGDNRTDAGAWGNPNRTGIFYTLFPYVRNSTSADCSIEIANATAVSAYLDILQAAVAQNTYLDARIDPARAVTKGFSINGKLAFVAAVFDDRVKAVVAGGAGATGPANWRYNAQGQEYDFTGTPYYNPGADSIVAHGTEGPGNSYRHNRVRETELFGHFLPVGHQYVHEDGSYGYSSITKLPFDQTSLVATLAPDRAIIIDTNMNDYNDGAVTDNMSLEIAKSIYKALGANADNYVKFNSGSYKSSGDPHGAADATPEGHYLSDLFFKTQTLTNDEATRLNTDPYSLNVSNNRTESPYDYYWGGYNTITGGTGGVSGTDGWYYTTLALPPQIVIDVQPAAAMNLAFGNAAGHSLSVVAENRNGSGTLSYQWYSNTTNSNTGGKKIEGAISSTFSIPADLAVGKYYYYVVIHSDSGAPDCTSNVAPVTVRTASNDTGVRSISLKVSNTVYTATLDTTDLLTYNVAVPYGTNLNDIAANAFAVVLNSPYATFATPVKLNNGAQWTMEVTSDDGTKATYTVNVTAPFVPITSITGVPNMIIAGSGLKLSETWSYGTLYTLNAAVAPSNATNKTITWSLKSADPGVSLATGSGSYSFMGTNYPTTIKSINADPDAVGAKCVLTATVTNGTSPNTNYSQDFDIQVIDPSAFVPVTDITGIPASVSTGSVVLTGNVKPSDATNQTITWSIKADGTTAPNAAITNGNKLSVSGIGNVVVTATIADGRTMTGMTAGTSYTKDFTINFYTPGSTPAGTGGSTVTPPAQDYNADVQTGDGTKITLPVTVNKDTGSATIDATSQKLTSSGTVITAPAIPGVYTYSVGIPVPELSSSNGQGSLTLNTDTGSVTVSSNMLTGVKLPDESLEISRSKAEISIGRGDKSALPEDVKAAIGDRPLVRLTISIDGKQIDWSNSNAPVTVSIPYTPTAAELQNPESIVVWYIDGDGNAVVIPNGHYGPAMGMATFTTTHFSDYAVTYNKASFKDVASGAWYKKAVSFIAAREITSGTGNGNYSPEAKLTRGEFIVLMMRAYGIAPDTNPTGNFSDAGNSYYTGYLAAAKRIGISAGVGNNMYEPDKEITRQEMFTLLYNTLEVIGQLPRGNSGKTLSDFTDAAQIDSWAKEAMAFLVKTGTVSGSKGELTPLCKTTRAEMAQVLYNLLEK